MAKRKFCLALLLTLIAVNFFTLVLSAQETATPTETKFDYRWFDPNRWNVFITLAIVFAAILWFISRAKKGKSLFVRRIAGLDAIEEAVGRATEMGKPVLYVPGISDMNDIQTVASMIILGASDRSAPRSAPAV